MGVLEIDDAPSPPTPYDRDLWPSWTDVDRDGCDTREDELIASSATPAQVDPVDCAVVAGDWVSAYDGFATDQPGELDIDHVVPLEDAHRSGGWAWTIEERERFANDPDNLVVASASSNRSKGSRGPADWRPPRHEAWCETATTWIAIKLRHRLTATTREYQALGEMLVTCPGSIGSTDQAVRQGP